MPFDALTGRYNTSLSLLDAATMLGIEPIPNSFLQDYKAELVAKHPGHWLIRHRGTYAVCCLTVVGGAVAASMSGFPIIGASLLVVAMIGMLLGNLRLKAPARWVEEVPNSETVPKEILDIGNQIRMMAPDAYGMVGELRQEKVVLDPYLVVRQRRTNEEIVLGIWDDSGIIRIATRR